MMTIPFAEMYQAILDKNPAYQGLFITAVKTTGIFCRPTCTARKPLASNVEFFASTDEALSHGYRPCKICQPTKNSDDVPPYIQQILAKLEKHPTVKIKDADLIEQNIEPNKVRRWFKANHAMTFHAYQRMFRINNAYRQIIQGAKILNSALDQGYESLSGFNTAYKKVTGVSPSQTRNTTIINANKLITPLGQMIACTNDGGICLLEFAEHVTLDVKLNNLKKRLKAEIIYAQHPYLDRLVTQITAYFQGQLHVFDLPLAMSGSPLQQQVWQEIMQIPYAETWTYLQLAQRLANQHPVLTIAKACATNPINIVIPSHRLIGSNALPTGHASELRRKKWLLDLEQKHQ